jgi:hypothetical protein
MLDLRRKRRALFVPMLNWIRFILNKVKEHAYPTFRNLPENSYDLYLKEQLINCHQHFKQVFNDNEYKFLSFAKDGNQTTIQIL